MRELPGILLDRLRGSGGGLTIVVVRLGAMGDILRTVPAMRLLRRALPEARIHWLLEEPWGVLIEGHADLQSVVAVPRRAWSALAGSPACWFRLAGAVRDFHHRLRGLRADLWIDFHGNLRSGVLGQLSGVPVRVGYGGHQQREGNRLFTTHRVAAGSRRTPRIERNLDLIRAIGLPDAPLPPAELPLAHRGESRARELLASDPPGSGGYAIVAPGASAAQAYKKPPPELLAEACDRLSDHDVRPWVVYGPGEEDDARQVVQLARDAQLAPPTDLPTLAALIRRARMFVGGDSGPLHLACATDCDVIALYGPTDPQVNRPWSTRWRALAPPGRHYTGIKRLDRQAGRFEGLTRAHVAAAVVELLGASAV